MTGTSQKSLWEIEFWDEDKQDWTGLHVNFFYLSMEEALKRVKAEKEAEPHRYLTEDFRWVEKTNVYRIVEYSPTRTIIL